MKEVKAKVLSRMNEFQEVDDITVKQIIEEEVQNQLPFDSLENKMLLMENIFNQFRKLGVIQPLIDSTSITEIMINGYKEIFIEEEGVIKKCETCFEDLETLMQLVQKIVGLMDRKVNERYPICDVRLKDGSRVNVVLPPIAIGGPYVTIRKFPVKRFIKDDLINNQTVSEEAMNFLELCVQKRFNIFVSGGTSSGKTTLLNVLSDAIGKKERVITIEDSAELQLQDIDNLVRLETRIGDDEYVNHITIRDLIKSSLRMRPDRIIVGEVRGEETIDMLQCMNTGHDGSLSTGHGNSTMEMLIRLETMVLSAIDLPLIAIRQQIASAIDLMVHIQKIEGKGRRIMEISEVLPVESERIQLNPIFIYDSQKDTLVRTNNVIINHLKIEHN
ncbi:ATPase, T2SS/T4P/T4SS family [Vallitaleaceae bacterium 9-2]